MFGYRHIYHAGNFADVLKHAVLGLALEALKRKDKPFCYLETHAGIGRYDLRSVEAQKTHEADTGIGRLWALAQWPESFAPYFDVVKSLNPSGELRVYPGSPSVARGLLRAADRMVLCELNKPDHATLKQLFEGDQQVAVHLQDGYQGMKAFLPPREKRGLVLIDPAFERKDEYVRLVDALAQGMKRWASGCYAIWYPIHQRAIADRFLDDVVSRGWRRLLLAELTVYPDTNREQLNGSGMLLINPPWQLDQQLEQLLPWLWQQLSPAGEGYARVEWLVGE